MVFSNSKLVGTPFLSAVPERDLSSINRPLIQEMRSKDQRFQALAMFNVSRRDTLRYLTAETLGGLTILSTEPAEARVGRLEMKKKVMEKLEKLREKAGVSKPNADKTKMPPAQSSGKEGKFPRLAPPIPFPNPQGGPIGPIVEAIVP